MHKKSPYIKIKDCAFGVPFGGSPDLLRWFHGADSFVAVTPGIRMTALLPSSSSMTISALLFIRSRINAARDSALSTACVLVRVFRIFMTRSVLASPCSDKFMVTLVDIDKKVSVPVFWDAGYVEPTPYIFKMYVVHFPYEIEFSLGIVHIYL